MQSAKNMRRERGNLVSFQAKMNYFNYEKSTTSNKKLTATFNSTTLQPYCSVVE
jgi:hypothetical protein